MTEANAAVMKVFWRVMPIFFLVNLASWIDRANVGFAALQMNEALHFGPEVYGFGAGVFFWGYALFEVPSNYIMLKVGAGKWIGRIAISIGFFACLMAFINGPAFFYIVRFLLGVSEAGLAPAAFYYIARWFPEVLRGKALLIWFSAPPIASIIIGPFAGVMLGHSAFGLSGWQLMFLIQGLPAIIIGIVIMILFKEDPTHAGYLSESEKSIYQKSLVLDGNAHQTVLHAGFWSSLLSFSTWIYAIHYFCVLVGVYVLLFWAPQLVKSGFPDASGAHLSFLTSIPFIAGSLGVVFAALSTDWTGDRRWHFVGCGFLSGAALFIGTQQNSPIVSLACLFIGLFCVNASALIVWRVLTSTLSGASFAGAAAFISTLGNLGGFFGPYLFGYIKMLTGSFSVSLMTFAIFLAFIGAIPLCFSRLFPGTSQSVTQKLGAKSLSEAHNVSVQDA